MAYFYLPHVRLWPNLLMNSSAHLHQEYRKALTKLQLTRDRLEEEVGNLQHELRRVRDGLERASGSDITLEQKAKLLLSNIDLCERDLRENQNQQNAVIKQLNSLGNTDQ